MTLNNKNIKEDYYKICRKDCNSFRKIDKWSSYVDESWKNGVWEENELVGLLEILSNNQKKLLYFLASKGGGAYQRDIMNSLDFLNGKDSGTLRVIKAGISNQCKSLKKMRLLTDGLGSRDDRFHEINRDLDKFRNLVIDYSIKNFNL